MLLSDLVDEYCATTKANGYAKNTIRVRVRVARYFLAHVGNIQAHNVTHRHVDDYLTARAASGCAPATLNLELSLLRDFWKYAVHRRVVKDDPTWHRRPQRVPPKARRRLGAERFAHLLDAAESPRDRVVLALGIYCLLRASEIRALRVADVDLTTGYIHAKIIKTNQVDDMPIPAELEGELLAWLSIYSEEVGGPLQGDWYLVPSRSPATFVTKGVQGPAILRPTRPVNRPERIVQNALKACGWEVEGDREGIHTLRRSSARALFDSLSDQGHDAALRIVQSALHHSSLANTERYIGVEADRQRRDDTLRGKKMFPPKRAANPIKEAVR